MNTQQKTTYGIVALVVALIGGLWYLSTNNGPAQGVQKVGLRVGDTAPDFFVTTLDGSRLSSDELLGNVVVLTSSAAWCATCVEEAKQFAPVFAAHLDDPVRFLTVDIDPRNSKAAIEQFRIDTNTPWTYADTAGSANIIDVFSMSRFEITYVIDQKGIVRFKDSIITTTEKLEEVVSGLL